MGINFQHYENSNFESTKYGIKYFFDLCFNDISNAMDVPRNEQISLNLIDLQLLILPMAAHAKVL